MQEPDRDECIKAIITEVKGYVSGKHWEMVPLSKVPKGTKILDSVWAFKTNAILRPARSISKRLASMCMEGSSNMV
eukprot:739612-Ditylum_brightwellii.AAC.1